MSRPFIQLALLALLAGPGMAQTTCPTSTWEVDGGIQQGQFQGPVFDSGFHFCCWRVQGDYPAGSFLANDAAFACGAEIPGLSRQKARFTDTYVLSGPGTAAIPVTAVFVPQFQISSTTRCVPEPSSCSCFSGDATVTLARLGVDSTSVGWSPCAGVPAPAAVRLEYTLTPGSSFDLTVAFELSALCTGSTVSGTLHFEGLPTGFAIDSCKGYHSSQPVMAVHRTWGAVKQLYR